MQPGEASQGDTLVLDVAVFHRAGVDGTCHIQEGVEYVLMDEPAHGPACAALTVAQEDALRDSIASVLYTLTLDCTSEATLEAHPQVYAVQEVRQG